MIPSDLDHDHLNEAILKVAYNSQSPGVAVAASGLLLLGPGGHELTIVDTKYVPDAQSKQVAYKLLQEYQAKQDALKEAILLAISDSDDDDEEAKEVEDDDDDEDVESSCEDLAEGTRVQEYEEEELEEGDEGEGETAEAQAVEEDDDDEEEEDDEDEEDGEEEG